MRQVMPHRNNIAMHRTKSKRFFGGYLLRALKMGKKRDRRRAC
jgi:hypothetical protein